MKEIEKIKHYLLVRLEYIEEAAKQGVVPGQLDTLELEQAIGRVKELKHVIGWIEAYALYEDLAP